MSWIAVMPDKTLLSANSTLQASVYQVLWISFKGGLLIVAKSRNEHFKSGKDSQHGLDRELKLAQIQRLNAAAAKDRQDVQESRLEQLSKPVLFTPPGGLTWRQNEPGQATRVVEAILIRQWPTNFTQTKIVISIYNVRHMTNFFIQLDNGVELLVRIKGAYPSRGWFGGGFLRVTTYPEWVGNPFMYASRQANERTIVVLRRTKQFSSLFSDLHITSKEMKS